MCIKIENIRKKLLTRTRNWTNCGHPSTINQESQRLVLKAAISIIVSFIYHNKYRPWMDDGNPFCKKDHVQVQILHEWAIRDELVLRKIPLMRYYVHMIYCTYLQYPFIMKLQNCNETLNYSWNPSLVVQSEASLACLTHLKNLQNNCN